ncbi:cytochrome P450 monooxygenase pc-3 [Collybia nuda]|uniref:Cytochrome P450 monooxygenase pc-3 n=1 Tax=Collybia nuda TaxID=64659 RepID=A0A9P5Y4D5_9AGAR|nr:cytochrome P450 monooxygenase pc-3 [Collybia nuda]
MLLFNKSTMNIPPGIVYIAQTLLILLPFSGLSYLGINLAANYAGYILPVWLIVLLSLLSRPLWLITLRYRVQFSHRSEAAKRGAALIPHVHDKWPGGFSITSAMVNSFKTGYPGDIFVEWSKQYGNTFYLNLASEGRLFTSEPEHIKAILATQFENFDKGPILFDQFHSLLGTGVFNSDGDMWKFHRTITRPFFTKDRISHFDVFESHANDAIEQATNRLDDGYPIDFQDLVSRFTLDSATEFLFGNDVHCLSAGLPYPASSPLANSAAFVNHSSNKFVNAFIAAQSNTALRTRYGTNWPLTEFWTDRVKPHRKEIDAFVNPIIDDALVKNSKGDVKAEYTEEKADLEDRTLLDHLVSQTQDRQILKDELTNLLVAARDTTASTLTFAVYMMTQHPDMARRVREEILQTVGYARPTYEDMKGMKYLRAFINETLRLYPPVPFDGRTANKDTVWPSKVPGQKPLFVPAETRCTYGVFLMHRRTDLWGPDAEVFDPDRFLDDRVQKYLTPNPFIFLPFNAGPRICLGQQFAYHESSYFLIRLLQKFSEFTLVPDAQPVESLPPASWKACEGRKGSDKIRLGTHLTMFVRGGLWVRMEKAKKADTEIA